MKVLILSGGGFKGAFQVPIIKHLMETESFDLILGTSVGAINGALASQGELNLLEDFWNEINDKCGYNGISGFLSLSPHKGKGLFSLRPLEAKVKKFICLDKLKIPFGCGVTIRESCTYDNLLNLNMKTNEELHKAIVGSSAIAGLMEPVFTMLDGKPSTLSDGGHIHVLPLAPKESTEITAIACFPLEKSYRPTKNIDGLLEAFGWSFEMAMASSHKLSLEILNDFKEKGTKVRIYAPENDLGSTLGATKEILQDRMEQGRLSLKNPVYL